MNKFDVKFVLEEYKWCYPKDNSPQTSVQREENVDYRKVTVFTDEDNEIEGEDYQITGIKTIITCQQS